MLTDDQVRAELERIDPDYARSFPHSSLHQKQLYRLLAESQQALREIRDIAEARIPDTGEEGKVLDKINKLARNAIGGK